MGNNQIKKISGRGTETNPANRFDAIEYQLEVLLDSLPSTHFYKDTSKTIITYNKSPDISVNAFINPYRGCEHGCVYCYARPNHEYLGLSAGLDFESKIFVKENAAKLLRRELSAKKWRSQTVGISGVTDAYQPIERHLQLTRSCLELFAEFRNPVTIVTKNKLVTRDIDLLKELARFNAVCVFISVTTLDPELVNIMEPRTSRPELRLETISELSENNIPTGVLIGPVIPGLTDHEIPGIIEESSRAGAQLARYLMLRLPHGLKDIFEGWLGTHFPDRKEKILNRIRAVRGGKLYDSTFFKRDRGEGIFADQVEKLFIASCKRAGIMGNNLELSTTAFRHPQGEQLKLKL